MNSRAAGGPLLRQGREAGRRTAGLARLLLSKWFGVTTRDSERFLDVEQAYAETIVDHVLTMQAEAATKQHRSLCRGTHAKGVCVRAEFEVFDVTIGRDPVLGARLAKGIFATPGIYPATVRFANSDPHVNVDRKADVRSLSFSVDLTQNGAGVSAFGVERQDFSMQSASTLPLNDARAFLATMKVLTASNPLKGLMALAFGDQLRVFRAIAFAKLQARQPFKPYQQLRYWSTVPFRQGSSDAVKQSATPSLSNPARPLQRQKPDALQDELVRHVEEDAVMSSFEIALQFLDTARMTYAGKRHDASFWIENASIDWDERQAPFHTIGRLTLLPKSHLSSEASDATYFDVTTHSTADSSPIGSINRARWRAEAASRKARTQTMS
jgi:hypothetical protein